MRDLYPYLYAPNNAWVGIVMKQFHIEEEKNKNMNEDNILPFAPITKTDGAYPTGEDWLIAQPMKTSLLCRLKKHAGYDYLQIVVADRSKKAVYILINNQGNPIPQWVNSQRFSNQFELIEVLEDDGDHSKEKTNE